MIQIKTILNSISLCEVKIKTLKKEYDKLNQIDMLSMRGNRLNREIDQTIGYIEALKWVLKM